MGQMKQIQTEAEDLVAALKRGEPVAHSTTDVVYRAAVLTAAIKLLEHELRSRTTPALQEHDRPHVRPMEPASRDQSL